MLYIIDQQSVHVYFDHSLTQIGASLPTHKSIADLECGIELGLSGGRRLSVGRLSGGGFPGANVLPSGSTPADNIQRQVLEVNSSVDMANVGK